MHKQTGVNIEATARYVPPKVLTNDEVSRLVDTSDEWITKRTGIKRRHISLGENASDLGAKAAQQLLEKSGLKAQDLDLILVSTVTPDFLCPSVACIIQEAIGAANAFAMDINAACSGFIFGFSVAQKYLASGQVKNVMLIGSEILTKYTDWTDRKSCVLFGDGAGGVILTAKPEGFYYEKIHSRGNKVITMAYQPVNNPFCQGRGGEGMDFIKLDGREVFEFAVKSASENIEEVLGLAGIGLDDINHIIPHQANARIIEGIAKKMKVDLGRFYINIENYGNTSAASIPMALDEILEKGIAAKGDKVLLVGFGGGLTWGSILLEL